MGQIQLVCIVGAIGAMVNGCLWNLVGLQDKIILIRQKNDGGEMKKQTLTKIFNKLISHYRDDKTDLIQSVFPDYWNSFQHFSDEVAWSAYIKIIAV